MSVFTRLWSLIRRPTGYVGKDLQGNYFYERPSTTDDPRRTRRVVKYQGTDDTLAVANRSRLLAVQWKAWLTHTRRDAPTLEELQADQLRLERLRHNVAVIEARDREERRLRLGGPASTSTPASHSNTTQKHDHGQATPSVQDEGTNGMYASTSLKGGAKPGMYAQQHQPQSENTSGQGQDPWVPRPSSEEPEAWAPKAIQRGG